MLNHGLTQKVKLINECKFKFTWYLKSNSAFSDTIKHSQWLLNWHTVKFLLNHVCKTLWVIHIARLSSITLCLHYVKLPSLYFQSSPSKSVKKIPSRLQICGCEQPITSSPKNQSVLSPQCSNHQRSHQREKCER